MVSADFEQIPRLLRIVHSARNCRDELGAGIGNPPLSANEAFDTSIASRRCDHCSRPPRSLFPEHLVDLVSNGVAHTDLAFVCGVLIDDHDIPPFPVSSSQIEPPHNFMGTLISGHVLFNDLSDGDKIPILQTDVKMGGRAGPSKTVVNAQEVSPTNEPGFQRTESPYAERPRW